MFRPHKSSVLNIINSDVSKPSDDKKSKESAKKSVLKLFEPKKYYKITASNVIKDGISLPNIELSLSGIQLVAKYYSEKYLANITIIDVTNKANLIDFEKLSNQIVKDVSSNQSSVYRHAFIIRVATHIIPIIYIRENTLEAILFADSLGTSRQEAEKLAALTGMSVYAVLQGRQSSDKGCAVDALVFAKDACGLGKRDQYLIPDLLSKLQERAAKEGKNCYQVRLPNELLKTAQISAFTHLHNENSQRNIHKNENLEQFNERYTDKNVIIVTSTKILKKDSVSNYLRIKGMKLINIIEIQFYVNQLSEALGNLWDNELRQKFVDKAKIEIREQNKSGKKIGIHAFAEKFLQAVNNVDTLTEIVNDPMDKLKKFK